MFIHIIDVSGKLAYKMTVKLLSIVLLAALIFLSSETQIFAHQNGCHRWHSCPSDSGSYTCGDTGYSNYCPVYSAPTTPKITYGTVRDTETIYYQVKRIEDSTLQQGETKVVTYGFNGVKTNTYLVSYSNGIEASRVKTSSTVTKYPVNQVLAVGTSQTGEVAGVSDQNKEEGSWWWVLLVIGGLWFFGSKFGKKKPVNDSVDDQKLDS